MITLVGRPKQIVWVPIKPSSTIYTGGLVALDQSALDEGVVHLPQASGANNATNKDVPFGLVTGNNLIEPGANNATYKVSAITDEGAAGPHSSTKEYRIIAGESKRALVEVALIDATTVLRAPIYNDAVGTPPSVLTATAGDASGLTVTTNACDFTPVANLATIHCRTGLNAGISRQTDDASTTVCTWDVAMPGDTAVGDTFIRVPLRKFGHSLVQLGDGTYPGFINCASSPATNYFAINVLKLHLKDPGNEYVEFTFDIINFASLITRT